MTHTYQLTGMTCDSCESKVKHKLLLVSGVTAVDVSKDTNRGQITMDYVIPISELQQALGGVDSKYKISLSEPNKKEMTTQSWFETYKPILLIFSYITVIVVVVQLKNIHFDLMKAMRHFMSGFFLTFSFFKFLNLKAFAESYSMYDILAKKIPAWGFVYAFVELFLGIAFLTNFLPMVTNWVTLVVMSVSIIGVLQSVLNKRKIQCACLGTVFNLPMSTVTIIEDSLMIAMSAVMITLS